MILNILKYVVLLLTGLSFKYAEEWWQIVISVIVAVFEIVIFVHYDEMVGEDK